MASFAHWEHPHEPLDPDWKEWVESLAKATAARKALERFYEK